MLVQRKSMSREIYIYLYISNPPQKLCQKSDYGSKFCVMTLFFSFFLVGSNQSIDTLSIIYHRCTGKEETTCTLLMN